MGRLDAYSRTVVRELLAGIGKRGDGAKGGGGGAKGGCVAWEDLEARKSFLGLFLEDARKRGEQLSEDILRDLVLNFLIAGRDTTAQALSWTIYCLINHPEVEDKVRREVIEVCGVRGPVYEDMNRLPYLQAVINEALRLYPSVPLVAKQAAQDDTWPDGTFIREGTLVAYNMYAMGRDRSIWGEDAEIFRPERWLEQKDAPGNYRYPVFNGGPRECLGRRLAQVEMKTCLAMLLPGLSFKLACPIEEVTADAQLTLGMGRGLPCFVRPISEKEDFPSSSSTGAPSEGTAAASSASKMSYETCVSGASSEAGEVSA